ncbi:MAG: patatin-like phospholipase family protein [Desulfobulbaceae bacterium]|nr:patatin-like phospholipase family protein [Desulfobulbaceae bacterium]
MSEERTPRQIGLALGGGSARGWAHIGIIHALKKIGIKPKIVCGCSIGALVGASYAPGNLKKLESWVHSLTTRTVVSFLELDFSFKGFVDAKRLQTFLNQNVCDEKMEFADLSKQFATVSTDLETGREIWFTKGSVLNAVWASISLPGLFPPIQSQGRWLVDGGLVNPVPVSICRALDADIVIAVNLNGDIVGKHFTHKRHGSAITQAIKIFSNSLFTKN